MKITYLSDTTKYLKLEAAEITTFASTLGAHTGMTITVTKNCGTPVVQTYSTTDILLTTSLFYIASGILYVKPGMFGLTELVDGVYNIEVKMNKTTGHTTITNCLFVDVLFSCKVAALLKNILSENESAITEKSSTLAHILHYSLVNGSNCGCNCTEMCLIFQELEKLLSDPQIDADCGC